MKIDDNIYPVVSENNVTTFTNKILDYPLNQALDNNIVYSVGVGNYACNSANVIINYSGTNSSSSVVFPLYSNQYAQNLLLAATIDGFAPHDNNRLYDTRMGYGVDDFPKYNNLNLYDSKLIRGFAYYSEMACIYVTYQTSNNPLQVSQCDLKTYQTNFSDKKILNVFVKIWAGGANRRWVTGISMSKYDNRKSIYFSTETETVSDEIINYTVDVIRTNANTMSPSLTDCIMLLGLVSYDTNYKSASQIINKRAGTIFYNSNFNKVKWNEMINLSNDSKACYIPNFQLTAFDCYHLAACLGILFTPDENIAKSLDLTNDENISNIDLYFPVYDENKMWAGDYVHGDENKTTDQYKDKWNLDKNAPFTNGSPSVDQSGDPNKYEDDFSLAYSSPIMGFTNKYLMSVDQLINLAKFLNNADESKFEMILHNLEFAGTNPLNCVTSIQYMPVNIGVVNYNPVNIVLGKLTCNEETTGISGGISGTLLTNANPQVYCGWCYCPLEHENYLDYAPYTAYMMYLPFAGYVDLDADVVSGKYIQVYMNIDVYSGSCIYDIRVSGDSSNHGNRYKTVAGNVSTPISIQGTDSNAFANSLMQNLTRSFQCSGSFTNSAIDVGFNTALIETLDNVDVEDISPFSLAKAGIEYNNRLTKSISNTAVNAGNFLSSIYSVLATPMTFTEVGSASGNAMKNMATQVFLYRYTMVDNADDKYGEFIGYACEFTEALSNLSGFTVCANVRLDGFNATETEKNMIRSILESGFYIT